MIKDANYSLLSCMIALAHSDISMISDEYFEVDRGNISYLLEEW
jgi:hypothetical protein